ncbi:MAG: guanylate kinase [Ruminococcaceae bacterium]|nr:guanylate kinase [Oscillospiraceae bacterium]
MNKGTLIILAGPSGSGKDTVMKELFKLLPDLKFSISSITRDMREGEVNGEKYNFITREEFESMIENKQLLEYNVYCGNYYGTPKAPVEKAIAEGKEILIEIDVNGAEEVRKNCTDYFSVFIMPPSFEVLRERLVGRGTDKMEVIEKRLEEAKAEMARANEFDYIVVNDDLMTAVQNFKTIIEAERCKSDRIL